MHKISSANMGFGSANIRRYYPGQQLIAQVRFYDLVIFLLVFGFFNMSDL